MNQNQNEDINGKVEGIGDEVLKGIHSAKSYVGVAWITLLLYYIGFYIIGLIVNLVFLSKSKETMNITKRTPPGRGCLRFLLWSHLIIPFTIIIILATGFIAIPSQYNVYKKQKSEQCVKNMTTIYIAIQSYMNEREENFEGTARDLMRMNYLKTTYECPEHGVGDKYFMNGNFETGEITVRCPNEMKYPKHKLSKSFINKN